MGGHKKRFITSCFAMQKRQLTGFRLIALKSLSDRPDPALPRRSVVEDDDLVRAGEVERRARPLIQHVAVEMLGPEQRDAVLERLTLIYLKDEELHKRLGDLSMELGRSKEAIREYQALIATGTTDAAGANYGLARAFQAAGRTADAREAVLNALEAAPSYKPAQKLLLELKVKQ